MRNESTLRCWMCDAKVNPGDAVTHKGMWMHSACRDGLLRREVGDRCRRAIGWILREIEKCPGDSLRDIANEAFRRERLPFRCENRTYSVRDVGHVRK